MKPKRIKTLEQLAHYRVALNTALSALGQIAAEKKSRKMCNRIAASTKEFLETQLEEGRLKP